MKPLPRLYFYQKVVLLGCEIVQDHLCSFYYLNEEEKGNWDKKRQSN